MLSINAARCAVAKTCGWFFRKLLRDARSFAIVAALSRTGRLSHFEWRHFCSDLLTLERITSELRTKPRPPDPQADGARERPYSL
ncbi:MAG: hypothetical protein ABSF75_16535, partial [Terracidiphilus sp.]